MIKIRNHLNAAIHNIDETQFNLAIDLWNKGELDNAIAILQSLLLKSEHAIIYRMLGRLYAEKDDHLKANEHCKKATKLSPKWELASVGVYLSYLELDKDKEAIEELKRYLDSYPPKIYKTTLLELLGDLENGFATNYEDIIRELAAKYKISLDEE